MSRAPLRYFATFIAIIFCGWDVSKNSFKNKIAELLARRLLLFYVTQRRENLIYVKIKSNWPEWIPGFDHFVISNI